MKLADFLLPYVKNLGLLVRIKEFDTSTSEGRSKERYRRAAMTALASGGAKVVSILAMLISVPLTFNYLGPERYGLWMTIGSLVTMLGFADLGMGLGLMNAISAAHGTDDRGEALTNISSSLFMLLTMAVVILISFALAYPFIPWPKLFNVKSPLAVQEAGPAMAVFLVCVALNLPLGIVQRVQMGYQEGYVNSLWEGVGKILGLLALLVVIYFQAGLVWLVLAIAGAPVAAALANSLILFGKKRPWLRPRWDKIQTTCVKNLLRTGLCFFILQIAWTFNYSSDNIIIAQFLGPEAVTQYSIPFRLFSFAIVLITMFIAPLWPAYSEAFARGDTLWARKTYYRSLAMVLLLVIPPSVLLVILGPHILHLWVGPEINPSFTLLLGMGLWSVVWALGSSMSMFLNSANIFKFQLIFASLTAFSAIIAKVICSEFFGLTGVIWSAAIVFVLFFMLPYIVFIRSFFVKKLSD